MDPSPGELSGTPAAISMGTVDTGALINIGNAPDFTVAAIAHELRDQDIGFLRRCPLGRRNPDAALVLTILPVAAILSAP
jgi:hypothetical protein